MFKVQNAKIMVWVKKMALLTIADGVYELGGKNLFQNIFFNLEEKEKSCLVGRNGAGKSTLLRILAGEVELDRGTLFKHPGVKVSYLAQIPDFKKFNTLMDYLCENAPEYEIEGYLDQLGLEKELSLDGLSKGEARKATLIKLFAENPDVILLDEPTNHLDIDAIEWLEKKVNFFNGASLVISHDQMFLENTTNRTFWMDRGKLRTLKVGFKNFEEQSEEILNQEEMELYRLDKKIAAETHWLHRGVTARRKRNQGRLKNLMDLRKTRKETITPLKNVALEIEQSSTGGQLVLEAHNITYGYDDRVLFKNFSLRVMKKDRIGMIGPNGIGKTTMLNILLKNKKPLEGKVKHGTNLEVAYFSQGASNLPEDLSVRDYLCDSGGDSIIVRGQSKHIAGYLKDFLFDEKQMLSPIRILSGGERNRLVLAKIFAASCNLMVLDEPTNDLDIETLDLLKDLVEGFDGTVLIISHDRNFLDSTVSSLIAFEGNGIVEEYIGGYSDYQRQRDAKKSIKIQKNIQKTEKKDSSSRKFGFKEKFALEKLNKDLEQLLIQKEKYENQMHDADFYTNNPEGFQKMAHDLSAILEKLAQAEEEWLELTMLLEDES